VGVDGIRGDESKGPAYLEGKGIRKKKRAYYYGRLATV